MTEKFRNISRERDDLIFNPKKINLPYSICILKPQVCVNQESCQEIIKVLEENELEIRSVLQRELTIQECQNLYYQHEGKDYYNKLIVNNSTGESLVMLISSSKYHPVERLKQLMGPKDPEKGKEEEPESLRAKYGEDLINNAIYR